MFSCACFTCSSVGIISQFNQIIHKIEDIPEISARVDSFQIVQVIIPLSSVQRNKCRNEGRQGAQLRRTE